MQQPLNLLPYRKRGALLLAVFCPILLSGQAWQWAERHGGAGSESGEVLATDAGGALYAGGLFDEALSLGGEVLPAFGGDDIWIARLEAGGEVRWATSAGGPSDETVTAMAIAPGGDLICVGSYWERAFFEGQELVAQANIKGLFVARYAPDGALRWVKSIDGTRLKEVTDVQCDRAGNIYLTGFFEEQLFFGETTLQANGVSDLFLLQLNAEGALGWAVHEGLTGNTRAITLALTPEEELVVGGYFDDTTRIANTLLTANTFDRDVFIARYSAQGQALWVRKAGGVHPDEIAAVAVDASGVIYAAGWLVGVMRLSDEISIQSQTGRSDFYLLRYAADGTPLMGRAMGDPQFPQEATDLLPAESGVVLSGFYQGEMTIDGTTISAGGDFGSFIAGFSPDADLQWMKNVPSTETALVNAIAPGAEGLVISTGTFQGTIRLDNFELTDRGGFDLFLGTLAPQATDREEIALPPPIEVFPVPARDLLMIRTGAKEFSVELFDLQGRPLLNGRNQYELAVGHLPAGWYLLRYRDAEGWQQRSVLISR